MISDAVKTALESLKRTEWSQHTEGFNKGIDAAIQALAALEQSGEPVAKLHYSGDVMEAVQKLLERGRATLDSDGYLVAFPTEATLPTLQRLGQEFDGEGDRYLAGYTEGSANAEAQMIWMQDKAWQDAVLSLVHYRNLASRTWLIGHEEAEAKLAEWWERAGALANTKTAEDIAALSTPTPAQVEPVAYRYVHLDYAGRKVSRYGAHPERVNGHDPIETHPLYASPPARLGQGDKGEGGEMRDIVVKLAKADCECDSFNGFTNCLSCSARATIAASQKGDE